MQFSELYGTELTRELGTADTTVRFTTARRKAAINAGQLEFLKRTECLQRRVSIAIVDEQQEYDLETSIADFGWLAKNGLKIAITSSGVVRYIGGRDLEQTTVERLDDEEPNWQAVTPGTPSAYYLRRDGGAVYLGLHPAPAISGSDTWAVLVTAVVIPADLSADVDEPFTVSSNAVKSLRLWHRALVYYAAFDLEKLRKDTERSAMFLQLFEKEVLDYTSRQAPKGGQRIRLARDYRGDARGGSGRRDDPRVWP